MAAQRTKEEDRRTQRVCWSYEGQTEENENERGFLILSDSDEYAETKILVLLVNGTGRFLTRNRFPFYIFYFVLSSLLLFCRNNGVAFGPLQNWTG